MLKSEIKKIVFKRLDEALKPLGWKRVCDSSHNPIYVFDNSFYKVKFDIQFVKEPIEFFPIELAIKEVEPYITECIGDTEWRPGDGILIDNKTVFRTTSRTRPIWKSTMTTLSKPKMM